jgi:serine phosphatase RsbU (regulator of sigma subunit)
MAAAPELQIRTPDNRVRRQPLEGTAFSVGRAHANDLSCPEDASLSRRHLVLERDGEGWWVRDLESKNGTLLNGVRIAGRQRLQSGDRLSAGQLTLSFVDPDAGTPDHDVVFVPGAGPELPPGATVMTSLEGLLSGVPTGPAALAPGVVAAPQRMFEIPAVRALIRAGQQLAAHQPLEELFPLILELSIEAVGAERGVLMTLEAGQLATQAVHGEGFRISTTVRDRVLQEKTSLLVRDVGQEEALVNQLSISGQQIHSLMAVPLQTQNQVIGLIYVDSRLFVREFTPDDLSLLTVLANVAAIRIDHERHLALQRLEQLHRRELEQAAEIQRGILPAAPPQMPGLDLAGHNAPCRTVGGDYFDFIVYPDGRLAIFLGDVAGKGMSAALLMSSLQARVQLLTEEPMRLCELMARLDRSIAAKCPSNRFVSLFACLIDAATGDTVYCNAGHNPALLVRATGEIERLEAVGTVLGILPDLGYEESAVTLGPGDLIAIYSDGVTEATDPDEQEFGERRLGEVLRENRHCGAATIVGAVNRAVELWSRSAPAEDDVTLVVARRPG